MKRTPIFISFILFIALCASLAYWVLQAIQPKARPMIAPPVAAQVAPPLSSAAVLLGGSATASASGDYILSGIILAARPAERIAILASQGQAAHPYPLHAVIKLGINLAEIHDNYVVLDYHGVMKRIDLTATKKLHVNTTTSSQTIETFNPATSTPRQLGQ